MKFKMALVMLALLISTSLFLFISKTSHPNDISTQLLAVNKQLSLLEKSLNTPQQQAPVDDITKHLTQLSERIAQLHTIHPEQLAQTETHLSDQLQNIQTVVNHLDTKVAAVHYLPLTNLPFHVMSLDSIQHVSVASITYDFKVVPMEKGDMMAGWTLVALDYGKQRLEFENSKKERVLITHKNIG